MFKIRLRLFILGVKYFVLKTRIAIVDTQYAILRWLHERHIYLTTHDND